MATRSTKTSNGSAQRGNGGETHQPTTENDATLTTNQGVPIADNQNSLRQGTRGPTLMEDFILREKITHFDHERIPERIVHARGSGAHGYFQPSASFAHLTKASFLQDPKKKTPVFARFSTVAGGAGSGDLPRDVRGFAVKFYTEEGNFDLVGNNIPVFFIQDAIKFPDLIHSVKMEPDRGFPQAASAHDTFWDFATLMPESMHMLMWAMSDRAIPRSLRMMEGFGIHTFRFINERGKSSFVKFHWRPKLGTASVVWDEAVKINGADPDFHRRDLWQAIEDGDFPTFEFSVQCFDAKVADGLEFDVLDPTKLIPEEIVPLQPLGTMVLNRNPVNFFAETEQVAFHPGHLVPGIDFTNDPLLQGRLHSYLDTQLSRLGGPNFHEIPINQPRCPMRNFQRDGHMRMNAVPGRVNYEPNSLDPSSPRENPAHGFTSFPEPQEGEKLRIRAESFADHYSQARLFWRSMTPPEQNHIVSAFAFELAKVETLAIRKRMLGHLAIIDSTLNSRVESALGMTGQSEKITPAVAPKDLEPSPSLSMIGKAEPTVEGRRVAVFVGDGSDRELVDKLSAALLREGARTQLVAPKIAGVLDSGGNPFEIDHTITGGPSVFFDAVVVVLTEEAVAKLLHDAAAVNWLRDTYSHLKVVGYTPTVIPLLEKAQIELDAGLIALADTKSVPTFVKAAKQGRIWDRESALQSN